MAYVVPRRSGGWELRESVAGPRGPRSRTLVSFTSLGQRELERGIERAHVSVEPADLVAAARRAGAPVEPAPAEAAAATLLSGLSRGEQLPRRWRRALAELLETGAGETDLAERAPASESEIAAAAWAGASLERRAEALWDLLLLADRTGRRPRLPRPRFPGLVPPGGRA